MPSAGAFIPVRLDSERLPRKALFKIAGKTVLEHLIRRVEAVKHIVSKRDIVICTTTDPSDNELQKLADRIGISCYRGEKNDLIKRFYDANEVFRFDTILQIDGDDPLAPPEYCDLVLRTLVDDEIDVSSTTELICGLNVKAFTAAALKRVYKAYETPNNETGFGLYFLNEKLCRVNWIKPMKKVHSRPNVRLTLDYPEDLEVISAVIRRNATSQAYSIDSILEVFDLDETLQKKNWERQREYEVRGNERRPPFFATVNGERIQI